MELDEANAFLPDTQYTTDTQLLPRSHAELPFAHSQTKPDIGQAGLQVPGSTSPSPIRSPRQDDHSGHGDQHEHEYEHEHKYEHHEDADLGRKLDNKLSRETAEIANGDTPFEDSRGESTQPFPDEFFEEITSPAHVRIGGGLLAKHGLQKEGASISKKLAFASSVDDPGLNEAELVRPGQAQVASGDSDLALASDDELSCDELGHVPLVPEPASQFPEEKRFRAPKPPATQGKKRSYNGNILAPSPGSTPTTTPRLPVNPFGRVQAEISGAMPLSQVFKATQAPSSPMLQLPTSDLVSDRPSPNMGTTAATPVAAAGSLSSPVQRRRPSIHRQGSEPHGMNMPVSASQDERGRPRPDSFQVYNSDSDDLMAPNSSDTRRNLERERQRRLREGRKRLQAITAVVKDTADPHNAQSRRGLLKSKSKHSDVSRAARVDVAQSPTSNASSPRSHRSTSPLSEVRQSQLTTIDMAVLPEAVVRSDYQMNLYDLDGEDTQVEASDQENDKGVNEIDKENIRATPVQVPRTVSKGTRHIHIPGAIDDTARGLSPYRTESQLAAGSDQQSAEHHAVATSSSLLEKLSQINQHDAKQVGDSARTPRRSSTINRPSHSQQTATPPSSNSSFVTHSSPTHGFSIEKKHTETTEATTAGFDDNLTSPVSMSRAQHTLADVNKLSIPDSEEGVVRTPEPRTSVFDGPPGTVPDTAAINTQHPAKERNLPIVESPTAQFKRPYVHEESPRKVAGKKRLMPKSFKDMIPEESQQTEGDFLADIDILNDADEDYRKQISSPPKSSPDRPRKRRSLIRGPHAMWPSIFSSDDAPRPASRSAKSDEPPEEEDSSAQDGPDTDSVMADKPPLIELGKLSKRAALASKQKSTSRGGRRKRPVVSSTPDTNPSSPIRKTADRPASKPITGPAEKERNDNINSKASPPGDTPSTPSDQKITAPGRVWAVFKGTPPGYFPAICLRSAGGNRFEVRFDDGSIDAVSCASVRTLQLRKGDVVKMDNGILPRKSVYVIEELCDNLGDAATSMQDSTDIYGWSKVRLALKEKDGTQTSIAQLFAVQDLYLTQTMFNSLKGQEYTLSLSLEDVTEPQTPSIASSLPATPAVRHLRAKTSSKKASSTSHSFKLSGIKQGLFAKMMFAITGVDKDKKPEFERLITENGGTLLGSRGLQTLFNVPGDQTVAEDGAEGVVKQFALKAEQSASSFTAVITTRHCRTMTYLSALALNVPCLSVRWIHDCVEERRPLDWRRYLLASGESHVMDGAILSRSMETPAAYATPTNSVEWPLASMVTERARLLEGQSIMIVCDLLPLEKSDIAFFSAHALGARRVHLAEGEDDAMDAFENEDGDWDLICICPSDKSSTSYGDDAHVTTTSASSSNNNNKGRKRKSFQPPSTIEFDGLREQVITMGGKAKLVEYESLVQSLILGRLVLSQG